jgi:hypothetical protein
MRQYLIVSRIYFILSVINFALAAPLVIRETHEVRVDVVNVAKDGTAASQTLSRWDPRDPWLGSNEPPGPESSDESDPEPGPNNPWTEAGPNHNSPSSPSSPASSTESTHVYPPPGSGGGMASHDAIADGDQLLLPPNGWDHASAEANPSSADRSPPHQTPTETSSDSTSLGHAIPQWLFDDPPPQALTPPTQSWMDSYLSDSYSHSTGSDSTSSGSTGSTGSDDAMPESENFLSKLLKGKIKARTSGSRTVNAAQRELQDTLRL